MRLSGVPVRNYTILYISTRFDRKTLPMDRRVQETQQKLVAALRLLMQRYPWESITVATICLEAEISRSTFYSRLKDKEELMQLSLDSLARELAPSDTRRGLNTTCSLKFVPALLDHVKSHRDILVKNSGSAAAFFILRNMRKTIAGLVDKEIQVSTYANAVEKETLVFICGGLSALIENWTDDECRESAARMTVKIDARVKSALQGI